MLRHVAQRTMPKCALSFQGIQWSAPKKPGEQLATTRMRFRLGMRRHWLEKPIRGWGRWHAFLTSTPNTGTMTDLGGWILQVSCQNHMAGSLRKVVGRYERSPNVLLLHSFYPSRGPHPYTQTQGQAFHSWFPGFVE